MGDFKAWHFLGVGGGDWFTIDCSNMSGRKNDLLFIVHHSLVVIADCGSLVDPHNGVVELSSGTLEGSIATYTCDQGYNITSGDHSRTCQANEVWSGTEPICESTMSDETCNTV